MSTWSGQAGSQCPAIRSSGEELRNSAEDQASSGYTSDSSRFGEHFGDPARLMSRNCRAMAPNSAYSSGKQQMRLFLGTMRMVG